MRILAIADETDRSLTVDRLREIGPDVILSCGDLGFDYLDYVSSAANASLVYVPGNHDPEVGKPDPAPMAGLMRFEDVWGGGSGGSEEPTQPSGINADRRIVTVKGLTVAGLGGSIKYREGPNQYTDKQMAARVRRLRLDARLYRKSVDILITHSPPQGIGDEGDGPHRGFASFVPLIEALQPPLMLHGHVHPHGFVKPDRQLGGTRIVNVIPHKILEIDL